MRLNATASPKFTRPLLAAALTPNVLMVCMLVLTVAHLLWTVTGAQPATWRPLFGNFVFFPIYVCSALLAWLATRQGHAATRRAWTWFACGLLAWGVGQAVYTVLNLLGETRLFPSLADVGYLALIPCFVIGALQLPRPSFERRQHVAFALDILIVVLAVGDLLWDLHVRTTIQAYAGQPFDLGIALAYPASDLLLCALLLALLLWRPQPLAPAQLGLLNVGIVCFLVADVVYAWQNALGLYEVGRPLDSLWAWGAVLFGSAAYASLTPTHAPYPAARPHLRRRMTNVVLPNTAIVVTYALFFLVNTLDAGAAHLDVTVGVVTVLVLVRQGLGLLDNLALTRQLAHQAEHDDLTGLLNRVTLLERLDDAIVQASDQELTAVLFIDIDRMKVVNDLHGHAYGDRVLREMAARIDRAVMGAGDAARVGGDEFVVILRRARHTADVAAFADALLAVLAEPMELNDVRLRLTASVGVAVCPRDTDDSGVAVQLADLAMYDAKRRGKNTWRSYSEGVDTSATEQLRLDMYLRDALGAEEFTLHYQPIVRLHDQTVLGFEALMRWQSPVLGNVPPLKFIPAAEEHGLIHPLGAWGLHSALAQLRTWHDEGRRHLYVSVNVSAVEFARPSFVQDVRDALSQHGLPGEALVLELTESTLLRDLPTSVDQLHALRAQGVRVAVDDFGTGYSNLSHLQDLPVHVIKIDRSFVQHLERKGPALVSAIIALARHLDLSVVIEGIETDEQQRILHDLGGVFGQGYLFGRPAPASALSFGEPGRVHE